MPTTRRPLPRVPPPYLALARPDDIRPYRPLPTPPPLWADSSSTSSINSVYLRTPSPSRSTICDSSSSFSSFTSFSSTSSELPPKPRPRLRLVVTSPTLRKGTSLDSLAVQPPTICDPGQLPPETKLKTIWPRRASQLSATSSTSPPVFVARTDTHESEEDAPHIPQSKCSTLDRIVTPPPPLSRPPSIFKDRVGINHPVVAIRASINVISDYDGDGGAEGLNPHAVSPIDFSDGRESRASSTKSRKPFPSIVKVSMKSHLLRPKAKPTKSSGAPVTGARRVSQIPSPLDQAWYKEQDGWIWAESDISGVLAELRKLR